MQTVICIQRKACQDAETYKRTSAEAAFTKNRTCGTSGNQGLAPAAKRGVNAWIGEALLCCLHDKVNVVKWLVCSLHSKAIALTESSLLILSRSPVMFCWFHKIGSPQIQSACQQRFSPRRPGMCPLPPSAAALFWLFWPVLKDTLVPPAQSFTTMFCPPSHRSHQH